MENTAMQNTIMERKIDKLVAKAIHDYDMIESGDSILVAVSGGKDSSTLLYDLSKKHSWSAGRFRLEAIHIASDFCSCCKKTGLQSFAQDLGVPFHELEVPIIRRLKPGRTMNCYWCSTQRRTELIKFAIEHGFNKLALGHHLDDIVETFFMNMLQKGELSTMLPVMPYEKYPVTVIRPLALVEERQIIAFAEAKGIAAFACTCPYGRNSERRTVRERIAALTGGDSAMKRSIFASMGNVRQDYLPQPSRIRAGAGSGT